MKNISRQGRSGACAFIALWIAESMERFAPVRQAAPKRRKITLPVSCPPVYFWKTEWVNVAWTLDFSDLPEVFHGPAFEYDAPYLFFPVAVPLSYTRDSAYDQPEFCAIWIVDIRSGKIVQRLPVSDKPLFHCVLQAVDSAKHDDQLLQRKRKHPNPALL